MMEGMVRVARPAPVDTPLGDGDLPDLRTLRLASYERMNTVPADPDMESAYHTEHIHTPQRVRNGYRDYEAWWVQRA